MAAVETSLPELRRWMPWAQQMPTAHEELEFLRASEAPFEAGVEWGYLLYEVDGRQMVGGTGLHQRVAPDELEIGYWVRSDRTGRGYATAAARTLTNTAFVALPHLERLEIHVDQANAASAAIPRKLGFALQREEDSEVLAPGESGRDHVWVLERRGWKAAVGDWRGG